MMERLTICFLILFCGAAFRASLFSKTVIAQPRKPNIILILTDDQGYGDVGRHGNPVLQTRKPNIIFDISGIGEAPQ